MESKKVELFDKLSFGTILGTLFLSLFLFIPYVPITLDANKGFLLSIGAVLSLAFWLMARLGEGKFSLPKDNILLFAGAIPVVFLIASFFSSSKYISIFGSGFEVGTASSMLVLFILFFLSSVHFQKEKRLWYFYMLLFLGATILSVFELVHIFIGFDRFAPGLLSGVSNGNLFGSWNDFGLFFGLIILLVLFTIEFMKNKGFMLFLQYFLLVSGLFFLVIINFSIVWIMIGLFALVLFVYKVSIQQSQDNNVSTENKKRFPFTTLVVILLSLLFIFANNPIYSFTSQYINIPNLVVRPLVSTTSGIALEAIKHNPFFGTGPNTFVHNWALWQPKEVVLSQYWNIDFNNGFSSLMTFAATVGIVGILSWLLFLGVLIKRSAKSFRNMFNSTSSNYFTFITFITAIYSWFTIIFYTPSIVIFSIAFVSSGILIGLMVQAQLIKVREFSFLGDPRHSFFSILGIMCLMVLTLATAYVYTEKFISIAYFSKGSTVNNTIESLVKGEQLLGSAIRLDENDIYYRTISGIYVNHIGLQLNEKNVSEDLLKSNIQRLVNLAEQSAILAVRQNPNQYINHVNLGNMYSSLVPLAIEGSYDKALSAYTSAQKLAPHNPSILLSKAALEIINKNNTEARRYINEALTLKPNYTDAIFLLAQIETNEGNLAGAIKQAERAAQVNPNDPTIFFRLGLLRSNNSQYQEAIGAFEQAVILDPTYLNARFLLGQSYSKVGRKSDALAQYEILAKIIPDNEEIKNAIKSIDNPVVAPTEEKTEDKKEAAKQPAKLPLQGQQ